MFTNCQNLTSVSFQKLKRIGSSFSELNSTESDEFRMPKISTLKLSSVEYADDCSFSILTNLTSTNMTNIKLTSLKTIQNMTFTDCNNLKEINLPNVIDNIDNTIEFPKSVTTISLPALNNNEDPLKIVEMPNLTSLNLNSIQRLELDTCQKLSKIDLPNCSSFYYSIGTCSSLTSISVGKIKELTFQFNSEEDNIKSMTFPELSILDNQCISYQNSLTSFTAKNLKIIGSYNFEKCQSLTAFSNDSVLSVYNNAFNECDKLKTISLPSAIEIGLGLAYGCSSLTALNIKNVKYLDKLDNCGKIAKLDFNNLSVFNGITNCQKLTAITFNNAIVMQDNIEECPLLANVNFSSMKYYDSTMFNIDKLENSEEGKDIKEGYKIKVPKAFYSQILEQYKDSPLKAHIISV